MAAQTSFFLPFLPCHKTNEGEGHILLEFLSPRNPPPQILDHFAGRVSDKEPLAAVTGAALPQLRLGHRRRRGGRGPAPGQRRHPGVELPHGRGKNIPF